MTASRFTSIVRRLTLTCAALVAAGCQGAESPAAPLAEQCPTARVPLCMDVVHAALVRAAVADAGTRLVPALENAALRASLGSRLAALGDALLAGDIARARASLAATRGVLDESPWTSTDPADAADITAIEITLQETANALAGS